MKMKPRPRTPATIRAAILNILDNLKDSTREKTIDTPRKRLRQCIDINGAFTDLKCLGQKMVTTYVY
jgi:hypothetical protein